MTRLALLLLLAAPASAQAWPAPRDIDARAVEQGWLWARDHHADSLILRVDLIATRAYIEEHRGEWGGWVAAIPPQTGSWGSYVIVDNYTPTVNYRSWVTLVRVTLFDGYLPNGSLIVRSYPLAIPAVSVPRVVTSPD